LIGRPRVDATQPRTGRTATPRLDTRSVAGSSM
jgi:hypothetical protein